MKEIFNQQSQMDGVKNLFESIPPPEDEIQAVNRFISEEAPGHFHEMSEKYPAVKELRRTLNRFIETNKDAIIEIPVFFLMTKRIPNGLVDDFAAVKQAYVKVQNQVYDNLLVNSPTYIKREPHLLLSLTPSPLLIMLQHWLPYLSPSDTALNFTLQWTKGAEKRLHELIKAISPQKEYEYCREFGSGRIALELLEAAIDKEASIHHMSDSARRELRLLWSESGYTPKEIAEKEGLIRQKNITESTIYKDIDLARNRQRP